MTGSQSAIESADPTSPKELSGVTGHCLSFLTLMSPCYWKTNPNESHFWRYFGSFLTLGIKSWQTAVGRDLEAGCENPWGCQALVLWLSCFKWCQLRTCWTAAVFQRDTLRVMSQKDADQSQGYEVQRMKLLHKDYIFMYAFNACSKCL